MRIRNALLATALASFVVVGLAAADSPGKYVQRSGDFIFGLLRNSTVSGATAYSMKQGAKFHYNDTIGGPFEMHFDGTNLAVGTRVGLDAGVQFRDGTTMDTALSGDFGWFGTRRTGYALPGGASTDLIQFGLGITGGSNTLTNTGCSSAEFTSDTSMHFQPCATAATNATEAGWGDATSNWFVKGQLPKFGAWIRTGSSIAVVRIAAGISNTSGGAAEDGDTTSNESVYFRYSTAVPDANWMACSDNTATHSCTSTGIAVAVNTNYRLRIDCALWPTSCAFYVNDVLKVTKATHIGTSTTNAYGVRVMARTLENVAKTIKISKVVLERNN